MLLVKNRLWYMYHSKTSRNTWSHFTSTNALLDWVNASLHFVCHQLNHANSQLIVPLETFRKEQIGGAKVQSYFSFTFIITVIVSNFCPRFDSWVRVTWKQHKNINVNETRPKPLFCNNNIDYAVKKNIKYKFCSVHVNFNLWNCYFPAGGKEEIWQADWKILFSSTDVLESFFKKERFLFAWGKVLFT